MLSPKDSPTVESLDRIQVHVERLGTVAAPDGSSAEVGGVLNPAAARTPDNELLLYPRCVAKGNVSRIGTMRVAREDERFTVERLGYALEPKEPYELRARGGYGCEDPRVTFVPVLGSYVMTYTAFGPDGPRIALALSRDGQEWERLGLADFTDSANVPGDDKDAAFFPEPVTSPSGRKSLAFLHRPMLHLSSVDGRAAIPMIERMPFEDRESIRIAYVPLRPALDNRTKLCDVYESIQVLCPDEQWGSIKIGAGTPPLKVTLGRTECWMSIFHGVDSIGSSSRKPRLRYSAGLLLQDLKRPDKILYRSPKPILTPESKEEREGVVDNVVFPTGIDPRPDLGERVYDIYYGMGDYAIGAARVTIDLPSS